MKKYFSVWSALALVAMATACAKSSSSPTQPSTSTATTAASGGVSGTESASFTTPGPAAPADGAQIKYASQPVTLTVNNAVTTGKGTATYSFEVATDSGFSNKVVTQDGVAAGNGQTSFTLGTLGGNTAVTYYWRSHLVLGSSAGPNSRVRSFTIGPKVVLQAPVLSSPGSNAYVGTQPTLTVNDVDRSGPAGTIVYTFQVADSSAFGNILYTGTATETPTATSHTVTKELAKGTYWWRVQATDTTNGVTSPMSNANPFIVQPFDMHNAIMLDNPPDVPSWPETAKITYVNTAGPYLEVDFDKRDGPGAWPEVSSGDFGPLQYTLGACFFISGQWYCSAAIQFWYGRPLDQGGPVGDMAMNWYYDPVRWKQMSGHQPAQGETIGIWVGQGNLRGGNGATYKERSNVQLVQFGSVWSTASLQRIGMGANSLINMLRRPGGR